MDKLEIVLRDYLDKGNDKIDVTAVLALIKNIKQTPLFYCQQSLGVGGKQCENQCSYCSGD